MTPAISPTAVTDEVRIAFDQCLSRADETAATALVLDLLARGVGPEELLLDLIAPAQVVIGARWVANEWSVAQEHAATHVSERAIAALAAATRTVWDGRGTVVMVCPDGEWHSLAARMAAEVLRLRGFDVHFLGASVPAAQLVSYLHQHDCGATAISCMLAARLPRAYHAIEACRLVGVPVLAGGAGFGPEGVWARALGADMYAATAVEAADTLVRRWPPPLSGRIELGHLADGEYAEIANRRGEALDVMLRQLADHAVLTDDRSELLHNLIVENLGFLLDNLAAAVFVDDARVITAFLEFTAGLLAARGVPTGCLDVAVRALIRPLHGLPRALGHLAAGRDWLELSGCAPQDG